MNFESQLSRLQAGLQACVRDETAVSTATMQKWIAELDEMKDLLNGLNMAVQRVADVSLGLTLMSRLFEEAHSEKLDADQVWCLIDPMREKLDRAIEDVKEAM